jgi:hypothetical protein
VRATACLWIATAAVAAVTGSARATVTPSCGALSIGPGAVTHGSTRAAACLLHAFQQHCRPASYRLSTFGVDTIAVDDFRVAATAGRCRITVATSFRVVPNRVRPGAVGVCASLVSRGVDIVATGCKVDGLPAVISLTTRG